MVDELRAQPGGVGQVYQKIRIMTFGIGTFCNVNFLKVRFLSYFEHV